MDETNVSNESDRVKSTAVVKYSVPKPAQFMKLKCNTDLNLPPSNWLSSSADTYGLQHLLYHQKGFSSFRMAQLFPDCIGAVDVVSDAENIKNLLKIPYQKGLISMMVHRIDNTLLLDEFDIYKHILRTAETEWEWFKKFYHENIDPGVSAYERSLYLKNKTRKALNQKKLVSKFLYYSLVPDENDVTLNNQYLNKAPLPLSGPLLPNPSPNAEVPGSSSYEHTYNRNVVWTFEDIEMLLGTDMPIFGGGTHPCISLRLNDMSKPISVLTGIDYWLDNLMSNVPEVVMCYHLNGIVQKYELIKTEDLPRLENSKFSPRLIRDVAQSILSFLKSNTTKAGHTYWLFKGKDEDVVKLYDLTSLCSDQMIDNDQNPFTVPVAMLLYKVARNMKHSEDRNKPGTIRMLLKNCLKLLAEEKFPEIVTSSHYMLSDLYVPAETNPDNPELDNSEEYETDSVYEDDIDEDNKTENATKVLYLDSGTFCEDTNKPPPPIVGTVDERCMQAVYHIAAGMNCLQYFQEDTEKEKLRKEEENIPMAKPFEPIPMPYSKLSSSSEQGGAKNKSKKTKDKIKKNTDNLDIVNTCENKNALLPKEKGEAQPIWKNVSMADISWKDHLKLLLYEKAVLIYAILAEHHYLNKNYGNSLRYLGILSRCLQILNKLTNRNSLKESCLLGRAGDCCIMMVQNWELSETYINQFHINSDEDTKLLEQIEKEEQFLKISLLKSSMKCVLLYDIRTIEQMLLKSVECYEEALKSGESDSILRRLGNSYNEVGSFYLHRGKNSTDESLVTDACKKASSYLKKGLEVFEKVKDESNMALLYANIGHLHRLLAHISTPIDRGELTNKEKVHYNKAYINYKKAMQVLGDRKHNPNIWDAVNWELSTTLFNMGIILHENPAPGLSKQEAGKEIIEMMQKALQYCDFDEENPKYPLYQFRAATIHYRLGSLFHNQIFTGDVMEANKKKISKLAQLHYQKSASLYLVLCDGLGYLTAQMQRLALVEFLAETSGNQNSKLTQLQNCLSILASLSEMLELIVQGKVDVPEEDVKNFDPKAKFTTFKSYSSILILAKQRLQSILRFSVKLSLIKPPINKDCVKLIDVYKNCYTLSFDLENCDDFNGFVKKMYVVTSEVSEKIKDVNR